MSVTLRIQVELDQLIPPMNIAQKIQSFEFNVIILNK